MQDPNVSLLIFRANYDRKKLNLAIGMKNYISLLAAIEKEKDVKLWWHGRGTREEVAKLRIIVASFCITFPNCTPRFKKKDYVAAAWRKNAGRNKNEARGKPWNATTRRGKRASFANLHFSRLSRDLAPCSVFSLIHEQGRDLTIEIQEK